MYGYRLGTCCHWCGEIITARRAPKSGKHVFCNDAHKMALTRAFAKWLKRSVTAGSGSRPGQADQLQENGNAKRSAGRATSSAEISPAIAKKGNGKKRSRPRESEPPWDED
jgi:hypothetical protein